MSRREKRSTQQYLQSARRMAVLVPALKKYRNRKTLSPQEKGAITRKEKALRHAYNLRPVNKKIAKELKDILYAPGVQAIQFNNISPTAKIKRIKKGIYLQSNGRDWIYWKLPEVDGYSIGQAGQDIFSDTFDIEKIAKLAKRAYKNPTVSKIHLWTKSGRVGEGFGTFDEFMQWIYADYSTYKDTEKWVVGIAILLKDGPKGKKRDLEEFDNDDLDEDDEENFIAPEYLAKFVKPKTKPVYVQPRQVFFSDSEAIRWFNLVRTAYVGWTQLLLKDNEILMRYEP